MDPLIAVLTSMITPAVLILACGSLILTTSQRLSRTLERTRQLSDQLEAEEKISTPGQMGEIMQDLPQSSNKLDKDIMLKEKRYFMYAQLKNNTDRARLLQLAMTNLYVAELLFVATSLAIGVIEIIDMGNQWLPTFLSMVGIITLLLSSIFLLMETRLAYYDIAKEMRFLKRRHQGLTARGN